jgi:lipopolysaccharide export system permease protein
MLFQKSLLRELRSTAGGVLAILMTTLVTMILIRALGRVASGRVDGELVLPLIVFNTVSLMNTVLMLTVYISVLMVLSRWWRDSEMVIWLASGKSLVDFIQPVWRFLWPTMLVVALLSTVVAPWARQQIISFEDEIQNRGDVQRVSPGQFRESYSGSRVFFLENPDNENGRIGTVFIRSIESTGRRVILVSSTGRFDTDANGQQWVVLERGYRTDIIPGQLESRTTSFDVYRIRMDQSTPVPRSQENIKAMGMLELIKKPEPAAKGEVALRVGLPLLTFALAILAIPLAVSNARSGRAVNLILALLIYLIASNLFSAMKAAVGQGKIGFAMAWWPLPLALLMIAAVMFWWRMTQKLGPIEWLWLAAQRAGIVRSKSSAAS